MSHFTVLIVGENPEQQLVPFQENNMGNCPKEYLAFNDIEDEYREQYENDGVEMVKCPDGSVVYSWDERFRIPGAIGLGGSTHNVPENAGYEVVNVKHKDRFASFEDFIKEYAGYEERDAETGRFGYWENPNKKWDWHSLGGRWSGFFTLKAGGVADQARKKDIDFDAIVSKSVKEAEEAWEEAEKQAKEDGLLRFFKYGIEKGATREQHIEDARKNACTTFAVLKDGVWYERGEMGWWGCVSNEKKGCNWRDEYMALFDEIGDDELLSVYDCHI